MVLAKKLYANILGLGHVLVGHLFKLRAHARVCFR